MSSAVTRRQVYRRRHRAGLGEQRLGLTRGQWAVFAALVVAASVLAGPVLAGGILLVGSVGGARKLNTFGGEK